MTTPTGSDEEPIEESVRQHLWRVRARLVTPPDEARAEADLERMFAAARDHAHIHGEVAATTEVAATAAQRPDADPDLPVVLPLRPARRAVLVGQAAAAAVLLLAAGSVLGGLQSDGVATISALLSRDGGAGTPVAMDAAGDEVMDPSAGAATTDEVVAETTPPGATPDDDVAADGSGAGGPAEDVAGQGESGALDETDRTEVGSADGSDGSGPASAGSGGGSGAAGDATTDPASGENDRDAGEVDAPDPDSGSTPQPPAEPADPVDETDPADEAEDVAPPVEEPGETIIALPDPGAVDGFGGAVPCPVDSDGSWCLPDGSVVDHLLTEDGEAVTPADPAPSETPTTPTESTTTESPSTPTDASD